MRTLVCTLVAAILSLSVAPATALALPPPAQQSASTEPLASIPNFPSRTNTPLTTAAENEDAKVLKAAMDAHTSGTPNALAAHLPALRASFERMPSDYALHAKAGDALIVRTSDMTAALAGLLALRASEEGQKASGIHALPNVYGDIGQLLGYYAVEHRDYAGTVAIFDKLLAVQPNNALARAERIVAITYLGDCERAITDADAALAETDIYLELNRPLFLRRKGYCLIEQNKLEAAKSVYEQALSINAEDQHAINQLTYIRQQMAAR